MSQPLAALWNEHRTIAAVLHALLCLVGERRARGKSLDTKAIGALLYYLDVFPERVHHQKEERFLFAALRDKTSEAEFTPFAAAVERYVKGYREHMHTEEDVILKVACSVFTESDWLGLRAEWASHSDPLSGIENQGIGDQMIGRIVALAPSPVGLRRTD